MSGDRPREQRLAGWVALAILNCAIVIPWLSWVVPKPRDFTCLITGAQVYRHNPGHALYDLPLQARTQYAMLGISDQVSSKFFLPYNHAPYELVFYLPLTFLSYQAGFWAWRITSVFLLAITSWILARVPEPGYRAYSIFVIMLAFFPVGSSLMSGQDTALTLLLFAATLSSLKRGKNYWAGVLLGAGLFKLQLVLPIIAVFFLCGSLEVMAGFASSATALFTLSTAMVGFRGMKDLLRLWIGESGILFCIRPALMPNVRGLLTNISGGLSAHSVTIATAVVSLLLLLLAAYQARTARSPERVFLLALCFVPLVSFHTNVYDLSILIVPILLLLELYRKSPKQLRCVVVPPVFVLFCTPIYVLAAAAVRIGLLAAVVAWLWWAFAAVMKGQEARMPVEEPDRSQIAAFALPQ